MTTLLFTAIGCSDQGSAAYAGEEMVPREPPDGSSVNDPAGEADASPAMGPMAFTVLRTGSSTADGTFTLRGSSVLPDEYRFDSVYSVYSVDDPPAVDFEAGQVLLVDLGSVPTGGHGIGVTAVYEYGDYVRAYVELRFPGGNCLVTQGFTNPHQFVEIPTRKPILIHEDLVIEQCNS